MLVLTRKEGQRIVIGGNIVVDILQLQGNRVRVGVTAPAETSIVRAELLPQYTQPAAAEQQLTHEAGRAGADRARPAVQAARVA